MFSTESMRTCQVIPTPIAENEEKEKESKWGQHWQKSVAVAVVPSLSIASMYGLFTIISHKINQM